MGTASTPRHAARHRAETTRAVRFAELRRTTARLLAGSDIYADDRVLRAESASGQRLVVQPPAPEPAMASTVVTA